MGHGFTVMTWKQRSNLHSGRAKHFPDPKKLAKFDPKSRCCSQFFFMLVELSTTSTFLKAPQWTRPTTLKFWKSAGCHPTEKARIVEEWWLVFPSRQRSSPFSPQNSWVFDQTFHHCSSPPPLLTWPCSMWFLFVPHAQKTFKRKKSRD